MKTLSATSKAYLEALLDVYEHGAMVSCHNNRGSSTREIEDYRFTIDDPDSKPIVTLDKERNAIIQDYTEKEMKLYLSGTNQVEDYAKISAFWKKIANPNGTLNSAYGHLIWHQKSCGWPEWICGGAGWMDKARDIDPKDVDWMTPWDWALGSLVRDIETRQAYLRFSLPRHQWFGNKDQVCTMHGQFLVRNGKLNFSVVMRSNDMVKGLVYDLPFFVTLQHMMRQALHDHGHNLKVGQYRHMAHSMHIYEADFPRVRKMLGLGGSLTK
jgi:thymidylate synthase